MTGAEAAPARIPIGDGDDLRVLIAALDEFAGNAERQAHDEAAWPDDIPDAHVALLQEWAARARVLCARAEAALASEEHGEASCR